MPRLRLRLRPKLMPRLRLRPKLMPRLGLRPKPMPRLRLRPKPMPKLRLRPKPMPKLRLRPKLMPRLGLRPKLMPRLGLRPKPMPRLGLRPKPMPRLGRRPKLMPRLGLRPKLMPRLGLRPKLMPRLRLMPRLGLSQDRHRRESRRRKRKGGGGVEGEGGRRGGELLPSPRRRWRHRRLAPSGNARRLWRGSWRRQKTKEESFRAPPRKTPRRRGLGPARGGDAGSERRRARGEAVLHLRRGLLCAPAAAGRRWAVRVPGVRAAQAQGARGQEGKVRCCRRRRHPRRAGSGGEGRWVPGGKGGG